MSEIEQYISKFPEEAQHHLQEIRKIIKIAAPEAVELLAYGMPGYKTYGKPLVYFAGYKNHIGFYATPSGHEQFAAELSQYKKGKGSVQFPLDRPMPYDLIKKIVVFRVEENLRNRKK